MAGFEPIWGFEIDSKIAGVGIMNGHPIIVADIRHVNYAELVRPDWIHASTPCINASVANNKKGESELDMELAQAVCRAIVALKPDYFSLENVRGYTTFKAYQAIKECLLANGYTFIDGILNAADYGTPQTRIRLFLVASRVSTPKLPLPTHYDARSGAMNMLLSPWIGWHEAIKDLLPALPDAEFAPWQLKRLPAELKESLLVGGGNTNSHATHSPIRDCDTPAYTVTGSSDRDRAYVIDGQTGSYGTAMTIRDQAEPMYTIAASHEKRPARAYIGRVVKLTPRCLARFNGLPDSYQLPSQQSLACKVLGNMVMSLVMAAIIKANGY